MKSYESYLVGEEHAGLTVEQYLKQVLQYSGRRIQKLTRLKGILCNKKPVFLQKKVKTGDNIRVRILEDQSYGVIPQQGPIHILYEDAQLIVLNKPASMLVHPTGHTAQGTLANYLAYHYQQSAQRWTIRPLHRLDRETSGCVVFAKDAATQSVLEQQMKEGRFKRSYYAFVSGNVEPSEGTINAAIGVHPTLPNRRVIHAQGERAITHYKILQKYGDRTLLELRLETGRTHQIRVHLAHIGHPIIGDRMYGNTSSQINRQALHAQHVSFNHPKDEQQINVHAPLPRDIEKLYMPDQAGVAE